MLERPDFDNTRVINQHVDLVESIDDVPNSELNLFLVEQIALNCENMSTSRNQIGFCTREFVPISGNEGNLAALRANVSREHESEPPRAAGDHDNFVAE